MGDLGREEGGHFILVGIRVVGGGGVLIVWISQHHVSSCSRDLLHSCVEGRTYLIIHANLLVRRRLLLRLLYREGLQSSQIVLGADLHDGLGHLKGLGHEDGHVLPQQLVEDFLDRRHDRGRLVVEVVLVVDVDVGEDGSRLGGIVVGRVSLGEGMGTGCRHGLACGLANGGRDVVWSEGVDDPFSVVVVRHVALNWLLISEKWW